LEGSERDFSGPFLTACVIDIPASRNGGGVMPPALRPRSRCSRSWPRRSSTTPPPTTASRLSTLVCVMEEAGGSLAESYYGENPVTPIQQSGTQTDPHLPLPRGKVGSFGKSMRGPSLYVDAGGHSTLLIRLRKTRHSPMSTRTKGPWGGRACPTPRSEVHCIPNWRSCIRTTIRPKRWYRLSHHMTGGVGLRVGRGP